MKANEKKDLLLNLLQTTTFNLIDDFSASVQCAKVDWVSEPYEYYKIIFFPNHGNFWTMSEAKAIDDVCRALGGCATIETNQGVPVVTVYLR